LEGHVVVCAVGTEGGDGFGEGGKAVVVIVLSLGIIHAMITLALHGDSVAFPSGISFGPPILENVPLDGGRVGVETGPFSHLFAELSGVSNNGEGSIDELVGVPGALGFGGEDLLGFQIENKFFNWRGRVPRLVDFFGDAAKVGGCNDAISIVQVDEDVAGGCVAVSALADAKIGFPFVGDGFSDGSFEDAMDGVGVGPRDEVGGVLGFDLGPIVIVEETILACSDVLGTGWGRTWRIRRYP
jgi:hypothetical protein